MKNQTRRELNELIRDELKKHNSISSHQILDIQEKQQLDTISAHHHTSYQAGDMVQQAGSYKGSLKSGTEAVITSVNEELNSITLQDAKGNTKEVNLGEHGDKLNLYKTTQKEFSQNDKIIFTKKYKSLGLNNGDIGTVKEIKDGFLTVDTGKKELKINTKEYNYIDHAYAITNHKAQGQTSERSIFVGDSRLSSQNAFYVALTRAKAHISIYTQDKEQFRDAVAERQVKRSTLDYNTEEILKRRANELTKIQGLHKSSDRNIAREQKTINLLHKLSNSVVVSNIKRLGDLLLQSDTLNNLANRFRRDANITVRPEINLSSRTQQPTIQIKGESMQNIYDKKREIEQQKYQEANQDINNQEGEKNLERGQEKESFIDKIDKASELYERVEDIQRYLSDETGIKDIITDENTLGVLEDMALNYDMREITQEALESFKHLAQDVVKALENPSVEIFKDALHKAVEMSQLFDKQLRHSKEIENER